MFCARAAATWRRDAHSGSNALARRASLSSAAYSAYARKIWRGGNNINVAAYARQQHRGITYARNHHHQTAHKAAAAMTAAGIK